MNNRKLVSILTAMIAATCIGQAPAGATASPGLHDNATYQWIVNIETEQQKDYLNFRGCSLTDITRLRVTYQQGAADDAKITRYEDLWYGQGKPLGLDRSSSLDLRPGDQGAIRIKHKAQNASDSECYSCANAALRVVMDTFLTNNPVTAVLVPAGSFNAVSQGFQREGFYEPPNQAPEQPIQGALILQLFSEPEGQSQTLVYPTR